MLPASTETETPAAQSMLRAHSRAIRWTRSPFGSNGEIAKATPEGTRWRRPGSGTREARLIYATFSKAAIISSTSVLIAGSIS